MENSSIDLSFIIVTWNNEKEIDNCLKSILKFYKKKCSIIIIDNNSSDKTTEIIKNKYNFVNLYESPENLGFAKANNIGLDMCTTKYICYLNPDTILIDDIVNPSIDVLNKYENIGLVACRLLNKDMTLQKSCFNFATPLNMFTEILHIGRIAPNFICKKFFPYYYSGNSTLFPDWIIGAEYIVRKEDAAKIGGFSEEYFMYTEDMDFCKKVRSQLNKKIMYIPDHKLIHLGGASEAQNISYNKQKKLLQNDLKFVDKFYGTKKAKRLIKSMQAAYKIRIYLLKLLRLDNVLKKSVQALKVLTELKNNE